MINIFRLIKRGLSSQSNDIGSIFKREDVRKLLIDISRFDEEHLFAPRKMANMAAPKLVFMTDSQLAKAKQAAYDKVKARLQMPPVLPADTSEPKILAKNPELLGFTKQTVMFIDISPGQSNRSRLMSVREPDGTLRNPNYDERDRLNHMFYPSEVKSIDIPKMFEKENLVKLMKRKEYKYILDRACVQFEPDNPRYVDITSLVYETVDDSADYDKLRSTRHFGPMCLYLAFHNRVDDLIAEMLSKNFTDDAVKLIKIYCTCHDVPLDENLKPLEILRNYIDKQSVKRHNLDLILRKLETKVRSVETVDENKEQ